MTKAYKKEKHSARRSGESGALNGVARKRSVPRFGIADASFRSQGMTAVARFEYPLSTSFESTAVAT